MELITHNDIESAENWSLESPSRIVILIDSNCSSCKEWANEFPFEKFDGYEFSQMDMNTYRNAGLSLTEYSNRALRIIPVSAIYTEESFKNILKNISK